MASVIFWIAVAIVVGVAGFAWLMGSVTEEEETDSDDSRW
jgi:hypothetical protein